MVGKICRPDDLRGAFDVNLRGRLVVENSGVTQGKRVLGNSFVPLALGREFLQQVGTNRFEGPARPADRLAVGNRLVGAKSQVTPDILRFDLTKVQRTGGAVRSTTPGTFGGS